MKSAPIRLGALPGAERHSAQWARARLVRRVGCVAASGLLGVAGALAWRLAITASSSDQTIATLVIVLLALIGLLLCDQQSAAGGRRSGVDDGGTRAGRAASFVTQHDERATVADGELVERRDNDRRRSPARVPEGARSTAERASRRQTGEVVLPSPFPAPIADSRASASD